MYKDSEQNKEFQNLIKETIEKDYQILVEGKKDVKALNELGIKNTITINKPLFQLIESIDTNDKGKVIKDIVILTDFDKEGRMLYTKLKHHLQKRGIKVHDKLRKFLLKTKLSHIEGLSKYIKNGNLCSKI